MSHCLLVPVPDTSPLDVLSYSADSLYPEFNKMINQPERSASLRRLMLFETDLVLLVNALSRKKKTMQDGRRSPVEDLRNSTKSIVSSVHGMYEL